MCYPISRESSSNFASNVKRTAGDWLISAPPEFGRKPEEIEVN